MGLPRRIAAVSAGEEAPRMALATIGGRAPSQPNGSVERAADLWRFDEPRRRSSSHVEVVKILIAGLVKACLVA